MNLVFFPVVLLLLVFLHELSAKRHVPGENIAVDARGRIFYREGSKQIPGHGLTFHHLRQSPNSAGILEPEDNAFGDMMDFQNDPNAHSTQGNSPEFKSSIPLIEENGRLMLEEKRQFVDRMLLEDELDGRGITYNG